MASQPFSRNRHAEEDESYFISMADMMVGLLFVFIILLMYFALQFQQKSAQWTSAAATRAEILRRIVAEIHKDDPRLPVDPDTKTGVLHIGADVIFATGQYNVQPEGGRALDDVARAMARVLPCYTRGGTQAGCNPAGNTIEAIFIEGHTDATPLRGWGAVSDNMDLSALRATNTYRRMVASQPSLTLLSNGNGQSILSVSGYGAQRPLAAIAGQTEAERNARNRRIDFRIIMDTPIDSGTRDMLKGTP